MPDDDEAIPLADRKPLTLEERDGLALMTIRRLSEVTGWSERQLYDDARQGRFPVLQRKRGGRMLLLWPDFVEALRTVPVTPKQEAPKDEPTTPPPPAREPSPGEPGWRPKPGTRAYEFMRRLGRI